MRPRPLVTEGMGKVNVTNKQSKKAKVAEGMANSEWRMGEEEKNHQGTKARRDLECKITIYNFGQEDAGWGIRRIGRI